MQSKLPVRITLAAISLIVATSVPIQAQESSRKIAQQRNTLLREYASTRNRARRDQIVRTLAQLRAHQADHQEHLRTRARTLIDLNTNALGLNLEEDDLGRQLVHSLQYNPELAIEVLDQIDSSDRDDVAFETIHRITDNNLARIALDPEGREALRRFAGELNRGSIDRTEIEQIQRILPHVSTTHGHLVGDNVTAEVNDGLRQAGATLQPLAGGQAPIHFDTYSVTIDRMPPGVTPEQYLAEMAADLNGTVRDAAFDTINRFDRRHARAPKVGDIVDIDIFGPNNGSVVVRELRSDRFVFSTVETPQTGVHPEYGNREFGFTRNQDGSVTFHTRGASRPADPGSRIIGPGFQNVGWTRLMRGISDSIDARGGRARPDSFRTTRNF